MSVRRGLRRLLDGDRLKEALRRQLGPELVQKVGVVDVATLPRDAPMDELLLELGEPLDRHLAEPTERAGIDIGPDTHGMGAVIDHDLAVDGLGIGIAVPGETSTMTPSHPPR